MALGDMRRTRSPDGSVRKVKFSGGMGEGGIRGAGLTGTAGSPRPRKSDQPVTRTVNRAVTVAVPDALTVTVAWYTPGWA
jgi:hypothetical protein